ncbi:MAG: phosphate acyltransferase, partial [Senegalia sp. (in: firmicutes)]
MNTIKDLIKISQKQKIKKLAIASSEDEELLKAIVEAAQLKIIEPILIGDIKKTEEIAIKLNLDIGKYKKIKAENNKESAVKAIKLIKTGEADFIMKGLIDTSILLKEVLNKEYGLRKEGLLSHVMIYE